MGKTKTITIDDIEYVRKDSVEQVIEIGDKRIIVADRGWVFIGSCVDNIDGSVTISNAKNIRRWGTKKGLGELVNGPLTNTVVDDYGTITTKAIVTIGIIGGW